MAYAITNRAKFKDDNGIYYELHILKDNYVGSISEFNVGGDGFKLTWGGRGEKVDSPIHSSEITFEFVLRDNDDRNRILDIMQQNEGQYIARIYKNDAGTETDFASTTPIGKFWTGVIIMNESIMEDVDYPQIITLRAIDGLKLLKSKKFNQLTNIYNERTETTDSTISVADANGDFEGGYYTFHSLILAILNQNPVSQVYIENVLIDPLLQFYGAWWSSLTDVTQADGYYDCSNIIIVQSSAFYTRPSVAGGQIKYMSCYDVLEKILFYLNARIHQEEGIFKIVQLGVYQKWQDNAAANGVSYSKGNNALSFTINYLKTLSSQNNKRSLTKFNFSRMIKRLVYNIAGASESNPLNFTDLGGGQSVIQQLNLPGLQSATAWQTFTVSTINNDFTPAPTDFKSTYLSVESGQDMTFVFNYSNQFEITGFSDINWLLYGGFIFKPYIMVRINSTTDYYLQFNPDENKYVWTTSQVYVTNNPLPAAFSYDTATPDDLTFGVTNSIGSMDLNGMEAAPVSGLIEYYIYYNIRGVGSLTQDTDGNISWDYSTPLTSQLSPDVIGTSAPNYDGGFGAPYDFPVASCQLYLDGASPSFVAYEFVNEDSGVVVESGEEITDSVNFIEQYLTQGDANNNNIFIKNSTGVGGNWTFALSPSWTYLYDTSGMSAVHLPSLKAMTLIGMQKNYRMIMDTRIVRDTDVLSVDPWEFLYMLQDTIEGATRYFICIGGEYVATQAFFTGEWIEVDFDDVDLTNAGFEGSFVAENVQADNTYNNLFTENNI